MQNLTVSDLDVSSVTVRRPINSSQKTSSVKSSLSGSKLNLHRSKNIPIYNPKGPTQRTHPDDPHENSILADLSYIPEPMSSSAIPVLSAKSTLFSSTTRASTYFNTPAERSCTDEELQELVYKLQNELRDLKQAHVDCDNEIESLTQQIQQIREIMVKSNENMMRALESSCFVVLPCRHYVMVHKGITTLVNSKCPKCQLQITESYLVKHK